MTKKKNHGDLLPDLSIEELKAGLTQEDFEELGRLLGYHYVGDPGYPEKPDPKDSNKE
ncbi:hypothetical protein [Schleiferilactobacillus harbinensis]|jgi:hypothetical protein|uniref:hypothetical protein n=1 Tax=Schleiferilactobacillus harbinensis TaxID=304207 RepID=UPI00242F2A76|nr:hypothetical protein [Schleiferilactobacillus harbinensis]MCI1851022.1 hypothetical protein [Schleiferilactobacillus harbinensis]